MSPVKPFSSARNLGALPAADAGWSRRRWLGAGLAGVAVTSTGLGLVGCGGGGDTVDPLIPGRFIVMGDGFSDLGQTGARYTVNDNTVNIWAQQLASRYSKTVTAQSQGGLGYAQGHGSSQALPRSLSAQVDAFLAAQKPQANDVVLINLPVAPVLAAAADVKAARTTEAAALAQMEQVGKDAVAQVRRLVAAGVKYVAVCGAYDVSRSPYGQLVGPIGFMAAAVLKMNDAFKLEGVNMGNNLLYIDLAFFVNRCIDFPGIYAFTQVKTAVCTVSPANQCTDSTLVVPAASKVSYLFADDIHFTPRMHQVFGDFAFEQLRGRW